MSDLNHAARVHLTEDYENGPTHWHPHLEVGTVPVVGDVVWASSSFVRVVERQFMYPAIGSMDYNLGHRGPLVTLLVEVVSDE